VLYAELQAHWITISNDLTQMPKVNGWVKKEEKLTRDQREKNYVCQVLKKELPRK
jgi:hypothetical protein